MILFAHLAYFGQQNSCSVGSQSLYMNDHWLQNEYTRSHSLIAFFSYLVTRSNQHATQVVWQAIGSVEGYEHSGVAGY
jgi:hypothetical protein